MNPGDPVQVTNLNGDTAEGEVVGIHDDTVGSINATFLDTDGATLLDYWRGSGVEPDERVVQVDLGSGVYDYPESRVEVVEE